jgi:hypothetical protein
LFSYLPPVLSWYPNIAQNSRKSSTLGFARSDFTNILSVVELRKVSV